MPADVQKDNGVITRTDANLPGETPQVVEDINTEDSSTLPRRMLAAVATLQEASLRRWGIETGYWNTVSLVDFAGMWESQEGS